MATKSIVETPAGESIEVIGDSAWLELTDANEWSLRQFTGRKPWVVRALYEHGEFKDKSGRAAHVLNEYIRAQYPDAPIAAALSITQMFVSPVAIPAFERSTNGKRTHSIKLVALPVAWYDKLQANLKRYPYAESSAPIVEPELPADDGPTITDNDIQRLLDSVPGVDSPTIYSESPSLDVSIAAQVAMSLLTTCVEIISSGSSAAISEQVRKLQSDYSEMSQRLSQRLTENDSLRKQLRQVGDELSALRLERDGLRSRLRATEANLTSALKGDAIHAINGEIQKRIDKIMRVAPTSDKGE